MQRLTHYPLSSQISSKDRGTILGEKGATIKEITETSGVENIRIEPDGLVEIESDDLKKSTAARDIIQHLITKRTVGEIFRCGEQKTELLDPLSMQRKDQRIYTHRSVPVFNSVFIPTAGIAIPSVLVLKTYSKSHRVEKIVDRSTQCIRPWI